MGEVATRRRAARARRRLQGRALDRARRGGAPASRRRRRPRAGSSTQAIDVLADEPPEIRFEPLRIAVAGRRAGSATTRSSSAGRSRRSRPRAKPSARISRRSSIHGLVNAYVMRLELAAGGAAPRCARSSSPTRAAASSAARPRSACKGWLELVSERPVEAEADYTAARELFAELGNATREAAHDDDGRPRCVRAGRPRARREAPARRGAHAEGPGRPRLALRGAARARDGARRAGRASTRPSASRSRRARRSAPRTASRSRRRSSRSASSAPRRSATRRPRS